MVITSLVLTTRIKYKEIINKKETLGITVKLESEINL